MIDHITINVANYEQSKEFYKQTLAACNYKLLAEYEQGEEKFCGFGKDQPVFWIANLNKTTRLNSINAHIALQVDTSEEVQNFYKQALTLGAKDNGQPGPREHYGPNYYAAFIWDFDHNNIEVVCRK